ncbi:HNH endonuclease, partial [Mycolicibacterium aubagnense]
MGITQRLTTGLDAIRGVHVPDDLAGDDALESMRMLAVLQNVVDH